jgi:hypothetical protein
MSGSSSPLRVVQWSTGNAGRKALAGIVRHPELELVGVHAHAADKIGRDAADLCDLEALTGVIATNDADALIALDADCVCYTAQGETRIRDAVRFEVQGIVDGEPIVVAAHVNRLRDDLGPDWDRLSPGKTSGYKIEVEGSPSIRCELEPVGDDGDHNTAGITGTAMRVVNAIPAVCDATPGVVSILDLPIFTAPHPKARRR